MPSDQSVDPGHAEIESEEEAASDLRFLRHATCLAVQHRSIGSTNKGNGQTDGFIPTLWTL